MALVLDLEYSQSNDATTLTLTDTAGTYVVTDNEDGWGSPNPETTDIVISSDTDNSGTEYHLLLAVVITDKNGTETEVAEINLYDQNGGGFADASELTWDLTPVDFGTGVATDKLTDGVYELTYRLVDNDDHGSVQATFSETIIIDGDVRIDVYNKLRQVIVDYDNEGVDTSRNVMEALLAYSYLQALEASSAVAMVEELVNMLYTLDKLVSDGSHYTW